MAPHVNLELEPEETFVSDGSTGVEEEKFFVAEPFGQNEQGEELFNPTQIRVSNKLYSLQGFLDRMKNEEIELQPDFQRQAGIWSPTAKSRLIESLLVRIPLPAFYIDATNEDKWRVIDGLQRLTTLKEFVLNESFALGDLEIIPEFNGKIYSELPRTYQRRINETQLTVVQIEAGTPEEAVFAIFRRINTGGLPLSSQEIRHALFAGPARDILAELATSQEFLEATSYSIRDKRMADREFVLRVLAFMQVSYTEFQSQDLDSFLNNRMKSLNAANSSEIEELKARFTRAMKRAHALFGRRAFRKVMPWDKGLNPVNRALFEVWAVTLDSLSDREFDELLGRKEALQLGFENLMVSDDLFYRAVSQSTGNFTTVRVRFERVQNLVADVLSDKIIVQPKENEIDQVLIST